LCLGAFAQEGLKIGLRFSPIISNGQIVDANGNTVADDVTAKVGISYGLMANYGFTENYGIHSGVHIVTKGFNRAGGVIVDSAIQNIEENVSITTVEIPLGLKLRTGEISNGLHINGLFGLALEITASNRNRWTGVNPFTYETGASGTFQNRFVTPINLGFIFGAGGEYEINKVGIINFGLVYHRGITNMNRQNIYAENTRGFTETYRVSYYSLELGYYF